MIRCRGKAGHGNRDTVIGGTESMRLYETIFIIQPELSEEDAEGHIKRVENLITRLGGEIVRTERWGKKRLAYEINKQRYGYYVLLRLRGDPAILPELERHYRLTESIIRSTVISLKTEPTDEPVLVASEGTGEEEEHPQQEDEDEEEGR
jgi:small subunit ribosomal protein S6